MPGVEMKAYPTKIEYKNTENGSHEPESAWVVVESGVGTSMFGVSVSDKGVQVPASGQNNQYSWEALEFAKECWEGIKRQQRDLTVSFLVKKAKGP